MSSQTEFVVGDTHPKATWHPIDRRTKAPIPISNSGYSVVIRFHTTVDGVKSDTTQKTASIVDDGGVDAAEYAFLVADLDIGPEPGKTAKLTWEWKATFPDGSTATSLVPKTVQIRNPI